MKPKPWRNRIVGSGEQAASSFTPNPANWRTHPETQSGALEGVLRDVGWVQNVIVNKRTGYLVDGHQRIASAMKLGDNTPVPYVEIDVDEAEEALILATLDPLSAMAGTDAAALDALLRSVQTGEAAVQAMLAQLAEDEGMFAVDGANAPALPSADRSPIQQMTFTLHDSQVETVKRAMAQAQSGGCESDVNENSNGNALAAICEAYCG